MSILLDRVEVAAPRRFVVAALLSLLMPGLGHVYCGQVRAGLTIWGVVLAAWGFCLLVWTRWIFAPLLPALLGSSLRISRCQATITPDQTAPGTVLESSKQFPCSLRSCTGPGEKYIIF